MDALSKQHIKYLRSLWQKKYRQKYGQFLVEGQKSIRELFHTPYEIERIYHRFDTEIPSDFTGMAEIVTASMSSLMQITQLKTAPETIALVKIPEPDEEETAVGWILALDRINDPGNLGTIVRIADWFGVRHIWCSNDTVDLYNSKTLMACMGSFSRVHIRYTDLPLALGCSDKKIFCAVLNGRNVNEFKGVDAGILVIGNEANGLSDAILNLPHEKVSIAGKGRAESLNAAVSAGILCHTLIR